MKFTLETEEEKMQYGTQAVNSCPLDCILQFY